MSDKAFLHLILETIASEKALYAEYLQICSKYQAQPDPLITAKHHGKILVLEKLKEALPLKQNL